MPELGEIKKGKDIGRKALKNEYIWSACENCGRERWVLLARGQVKHRKCVFCKPRMEQHPRWTGGKHKRGDGYIDVLLRPDDFFYPMANGKNYVAEHRLVMAKHLNRCLLRWEVVHHLNGVKDDNRLENLQLLPDAKYHAVDTTLKARLAYLEKRVTSLEAENALIKAKIGRAMVNSV